LFERPRFLLTVLLKTTRNRVIPGGTKILLPFIHRNSCRFLGPIRKSAVGMSRSQAAFIRRLWPRPLDPPCKIWYF